MRKLPVILLFALFTQCSDDDELISLNRDYFLGSWQIDTNTPITNQLTFLFQSNNQYTSSFEGGEVFQGFGLTTIKAGSC